ncbi:hypothetical protein [Flexibacter flexilis]|uniref:hypothetical protein n=1 Tax=Flexibacter flexilis TaxID=998 RepID=UPI0011606DC7|nr:hypothetical protein [Flexibacter flexilis]
MKIQTRYIGGVSVYLVFVFSGKLYPKIGQYAHKKSLKAAYTIPNNLYICGSDKIQCFISKVHPFAAAVNLTQTHQNQHQCLQEKNIPS